MSVIYSSVLTYCKYILNDKLEYRSLHENLLFFPENWQMIRIIMKLM